MSFIKNTFKKKNQTKQQLLNSSCKLEDQNLCTKKLGNIYKDAKISDDVLVCNLIQGQLENSAMIAAMASLATNIEVYKRVVKIKVENKLHVLFSLFKDLH